MKMMTINDQSVKEILSYRDQTIKTSVGLLGILGLAMAGLLFCPVDFLFKPLLGAFLGVLLATLNAFALGYAYFALVLKKTARRVILWPVTTFLLMCVAALILALHYSEFVLGFAFGLTAPLIFGTVIIFFGSTKPA